MTWAQDTTSKGIGSVTSRCSLKEPALVDGLEPLEPKNGKKIIFIVISSSAP